MPVLFYRSPEIICSCEQQEQVWDQPRSQERPWERGWFGFASCDGRSGHRGKLGPVKVNSGNRKHNSKLEGLRFDI